MFEDEDHADARLMVETGISDCTRLTLLERKGFGHPDTPR